MDASISCPGLPDGLSLIREENGLTLTDGKLKMTGDLIKMIPRIKRGIVGTELLVRAARLKDMSGSPTLIDATAGMGEDSLLLAAAGFNVVLCEYNPVIAALLRDSLDHASLVPELSGIIGRMSVHEGDSIEYMRNFRSSGDSSSLVVYLDPMFPERTKNAMIKKKFQLLQQLELPCSNESDLLDAAICAQPHKIVIKRPLKGPLLAGARPSYSVSGKAIRFDCIVLNQQSPSSGS